MKKSLVFSLLFVLLCGVHHSRAAAANAPFLASQSSEFIVCNTVAGPFTNPKGVGEGSPFILYDNCVQDPAGGSTICGTVRSISATTGRVISQNTMYVALNASIPPVVNDGAVNLPMYIAVQAGSPAEITGYLADAVAADQWTYGFDFYAVVISLTYIQFTNCPSGFGGVSAFVCHQQQAECSIRVLDFFTGKLCGDVTTIPSEYQFSQATVKAQGFSSGGALGRPMIVVAQTATNILYGIDAVSGETVFQYATGGVFQKFVPGSSPTNELFAYMLYNQDSQDVFIAIRKIESGALRLQARVEKTFVPSYNSAAWGPSSTFYGGIFMFGTDIRTNISTIDFVSAADGVNNIFDLPQTNGSPLDTPMAHLGGKWTMGVTSLSPGRVLLAGVQVASSMQTVSLPLPFSHPWTSAVVSAFTFVNGTAGVAVVASDSLNAQLFVYGVQ